MVPLDAGQSRPMPRSAAMLERIRSMWGAILGAWAMMVMSALTVI